MMMKGITAVLALTSGAYAWGASGHEAVGYIAMQFLAPKASAFVKSSLGSTYSQSLGVAAPWADNVRSQSAYGWSSTLHYTTRPRHAVSQSRDCPDNNCILGAIANYTTRVVNTSLSATQRQEALKFLDHLIGDIGQPLHVENVEAGGNGISVRCNGATSNLHSVWDSELVNKLLSNNYGNSVTRWVNALVTRIKSGAYRSQAASWISCSSTTAIARDVDTDIKADIDALLNPHPLTKRAITPLACPLVWAKESNALDCSYVFSYPSFSDLCTSSYYTNAVPHIELQIAKQGYRLAAWLNVLFDGTTGVETSYE
ncbi:s1 p1 nuclease [Moniliophthora roreri MCA 2997]|uniref:S1 p1 nuclease n=1 Tax=Moniliophthora roreri (strain MCA 2997) TaxID=1381753 RepID=V2WZV8_MONRO|nr:s1 p1 nuclease [Moniliophthora roreri MCA 2997]